ncbi:MAG: hypothetical protein WDZ40_00355 [Candidatus Spechtbacterales bacterium]
MIKSFWGKKPNRGKTPNSKKNIEEFGPGKEDIIICTKCNASYYYKSWHHKLEDYKELKPSKSVSFELCPACEMEKRGQFEGEVVIENFPPHIKEEIVSQLEHVADKAHQRDPMDRILQMHIAEHRIEVRTSENQLALNLGRQVQKAHKNSEIEIKFSEEEDVARVRVWFKDQN